jgi:hypothetical protein
VTSRHAQTFLVLRLRAILCEQAISPAKGSYAEPPAFCLMLLRPLRMYASNSG